jgi:RHS repeat-associated protein
VPAQDERQDDVRQIVGLCSASRQPGVGRNVNGVFTHRRLYKSDLWIAAEIAGIPALWARSGLVDDLTGLIRFGARDYDPTTGRWTAPDPVGFGGATTNLYSYVGSDPTNATDPTGLCDEATRTPAQKVGDYAAGFGDLVTFGAARVIRNRLLDAQIASTTALVRTLLVMLPVQ